jgi:hypothetical protein
VQATDIIIDNDGTIRFIWTDDLADLINEGRATTRRASHVEPTNDGQWTADMAPVGGPVLGPYRLRGEALAAEVEWLRTHLGGQEAA